MRFESVTARSFGPFSDETLRFAPNLTVIHGPNESGKSSWHAVLYAAFCGMRRGAGLRSEDRAFTAQHKPWSADAWEVGTVLSLNDGRLIDLHHDLAGKVDCCATDEGLGRDVSAEIINDGSPDGSVWLGLDRRSFLATACVKQTDLLSILEDPNLLQTHLQRAAATSGVDTTAAAAISALEGFRKEHVGLDRSNSTKPLARAIRRVTAAKEALEKAKSLHEGFQDLSARAEELRHQREEAAKKLRSAEAAVADQRAKEWERRAQEAEELLVRHPAGPPVNSVEDDERAQEVATAIRAWQDRPDPGQLEGPDSSELRGELEALPEMPRGDLEPHPDVIAARDAYLDVERALDRHQAARPSHPAWPETGGLSEENLRDLARELEAREPEVDPSLEERVELARQRLEAPPTEKKITPLLIVGVVLAVLGAAALGLGATILGLLMLAAGSVAVVLALVPRGDASRLRASEELREAENQIAAQRHVVEQAKRRLGVARDKCEAHGLEPNPAVLLSLANALSEAERTRQDARRWTEQHEALAAERGGAAALVFRALSDREADASGDLRQSLDRYLAACAERRRVAERASRRLALSERLASREAAEKLAEGAERARVSAEAAVKATASRCGLAGEVAEELVDGLRRWQRDRSKSLNAQQEAREEWARLESLLDGRSIEELRVEAARGRATAATLADEVKGEPVVVVLEGNSDAQLARLRHSFDETSQEAARLKGQVEEQARGLPSVPEAEEGLAAAERELARVRSLEATLERTVGFLRRAEEKAHRDIAPVLAGTVRKWLPRVTSGRYVDARVDPETLAVRVRAEAGSWRDAARLSHGTAEQIYLLLRIAVAEHLTKSGETCPLILDDVTAQSDEARTADILGMLHQISETRQVILFSQEREVLEWARENLQSPQDDLVLLDAEVIGV